jgi:hypothetical protein
MTVALPDFNWQTIIWREWRNTTDEEYAEHLFELVGDQPVDQVATIISVFLGLFYGAMIGLLISLLGIVSGLPAWLQIWPVSIGLGTVLGGMIGYLFRLIEPQLSWRDWLSRLTFNVSPGGLGLVVMVLSGALLCAQIGWLLSWWAGMGHLIGVWLLTVLLAVGLGTKLVGWMLGRGRRSKPRYLHQYRNFWVWWRQQPLGSEIEAALRCACQEPSATQKQWLAVLQSLRRRKTASKVDINVVNQLQSPNWIERFTATHLLVASGGAGVTALQPIANRKSSTMRGTAIRLLQGIEYETTNRLADGAPRLLCPDCLVHCSSHSITITDGPSLSFYGCRYCRQSHNFWDVAAVAVLDTGQVGDAVQHHGGVVRINWLLRRQLFDFDAVEIIQAYDEDVERFAMQVGNDTDPYRRPRYKQLRCLVDGDCELSENTMRILRRWFGQVGINKNPHSLSDSVVG